MKSPILTVQNHRYPFGHSMHPETKVVQVQYFKSLDQLQQKKKELTKKSELIHSQSIIKLKGVTQKGMTLVYDYQFVPHSFESYLRSKWHEQPAEIWSMTKKLFTKKVAFELTLLTSYLGKMKIEAELAIQHMGIKDEKLKLYVSPKSKMGIKQEIQLIIVYNQNKQKILKDLQQLYSEIESNTLRSHQNSQNVRSLLQNSSQNCSEIFSSMEIKSQNKQNNKSFNNLSLNPTQSFLRQTRTFKDSTSQLRPRKFSTDNLQLKGRNILFKNAQKGSRANSPRDHKYSFQFGSPSEQLSFNQKSFVENDEPQPNYSKAKSIKIELEQKQNLGGKKQRKDSYKVKITTVRQYDLGQNPPNLFGGSPNNQDDIFQYFAKKSKGRADQDGKFQDPQKSQSKYRKETADTNFANQQVPEPSSPFTPLSAKQRKQSQNNTSSKNRMLEQRIRQAKQRTSKAIILMKTLKK